MNINNINKSKILDSSTIFISLYLFILIFFVLLTTIAKSELTKSTKGIESIQNTFVNYNTNQIKISKKGDDKIIDYDLYEINKQLIINKIDNLIEKNFKKLELSPEKNLLISYEVPINKIFYKNSYIFKDGKKQIFKNIINFIQNLSFGYVKLELMTNASSIENNPIIYFQMFAFYKTFLESGLDNNNFSVSMKHNLPMDHFILKFYLFNKQN